MRDMLMRYCLRYAKLAIIALLLSFVSNGAFATEAENEGPEHSFEHHGRHFLGPFIGITREEGHNRETIGIEYSYRINEAWSAGAVIERAERDKDSTLGIVLYTFGRPSFFI